MPSKYQEYRQMADTAERQLTSSYKSWTQFLRTAARLYKYPYNEQVMIHAQRPDATACAEYDFWNKKMGRFIRRGSTGIALIDTSGQKPQLRYVFDVADTGEREHSRPVHLWRFRAEHEDIVAATLERSYDVSVSDGIVEQMESAATQLAKEYWADHKKGCSVDVLIALSNLFGVSIDYLVLGTAAFTAPDSAALKADIQALIGLLEKFREQL